MKPNRTPRLKDIAAQAGVSVGAVSRILRNLDPQEFSEATRQRVLRVAEESGWRPNLLIRGLQTGQTGTLGVFVAPFDTFWTGVLYGIHDTLLSAARVPIVLWPHATVHPTPDPDPDRPTPHLRGHRPVAIGPSRLPDLADGESGRAERNRLLRLIDRRVDAIITWPLFEPDAIELLADAAQRGWKIVTIDFQLPDPPPPPPITTDEAQAMQQAVGHLHQLGHRRLGYLGLQRDHHWARQRQQHFRQQIARQLGDPDPPILQLPHADESSRHAIADWLAARPELTALIAATDHVALQAIRAARRLGRQVPGDLSIIGFGNHVFDTTDTPLTTVDQNAYAVGQEAARCAMADTPAPDRPRLIPTTLVQRSTTAAPAASP